MGTDDTSILILRLPSEKGDEKLTLKVGNPWISLVC